MKKLAKRMKEIIKKMAIILTIIGCLCPTFFSNTSFGIVEENDEYLTLERAGNYVSNFAIYFYNNWSSKVNPGSEILTKYRAGATVQEGNAYIFDNSSFIKFVYDKALSVKQEDYPITSNNAFEEKALDELVDLYKANLVKEGTQSAHEDGAVIDIATIINKGMIKPGDILKSSEGDYLLYVGANKVIYAYEPKDDNGALRYEDLEDYLVQIKRKLELKYEEQHKDQENKEDYELEPYGIVSVQRMKEEYATKIRASQVTLIFNNKGYYSDKITYEGIPKKSAYTGSTHASFLKLVIDSIITFAKFFINLIIYVVRMVIVGWVSIVESLMQGLALGVSGHFGQAGLVNATGVKKTSYSGARITIESLFYNKLPITDANFFNFETAGGYKLIDEKGNKTIIYILREFLATGYMIVRNISIVAILFVLIYTGIRIAIASTGEKKALYKEQLINWAMGLLVIFSIHFFMYGVLYVNENLIDVISKINVENVSTFNGIAATESSLYDAVRTKAYTFSAIEGTTGLIIYIMLVYLFGRFIWIYLKRMIAVYILGLLGPFMGFKYALDRANGKKKRFTCKMGQRFYV